MQNKSEEQEPNVPCQNCRRSSNLKCIWCDTIYCSVKCQYEDWKEHKKECLKSKGIVSELVLSEHVKQPKKSFNSHIVKDLNLMKQKRLENAEDALNKKLALYDDKADKNIKVSVSVKKSSVSVQDRLKKVCTKDFQPRGQQSFTDKLAALLQNSLGLSMPVNVVSSSPIIIKDKIIEIKDEVGQSKDVSCTLVPKLDKPIKKEASSLPPPIVKDKIIEIKDEVEHSKDVSCTLVPNRIIQLANKVQSNRKWKEYEMPTQVDEDGYFQATITDFSTPKLGMQSYIVSPLGLKDQYLTHLRQIQPVYKSAALEPLSLDKIKRYDLVVALFGITWNRAIVLEVTDKVICVRSIENGTNCFIRDFSKIKAPLPAELQKKGFIIEVVFENENDVEININSIVSIKMMSEISGTNLASLKEDASNKTIDDGIFNKVKSKSIVSATTYEVPIKKEVTNKVATTSPDERMSKMKSLDERKYLTKQMVKDFHTGDNIKITFLDGSQLTNGLAHFCEFLPENVEFYLKIDKEIKDFVDNNVDKGNYTPATNELVLAKYNDGLYYRGVCETVKDGSALIYFLDYGGFEKVETKNIIKLPSHFLYTICAHTCRVKPSGGEFSNLDLKATVDKLFDEQHFACKVEKLTSDKYPYQLTIDKSLVVFT